MAVANWLIRSLIAIFVVVTLISFVLCQDSEWDGIQTVVTTEETMSTTEDIPCNIMTGQWVQRIMSLINICNSETNGYEANGAERMRIRKNPFIMHIDCVLKCVAIHLGLLTETGEVREIGAAFFVDENVPEKYKELARDVLVGCMQYAGDVNNTETNCNSYRKLFKCVVSAAPRVHKLCYPNLIKGDGIYMG